MGGAGVMKEVQCAGSDGRGHEGRMGRHKWSEMSSPR